MFVIRPPWRLLVAGFALAVALAGCADGETADKPAVVNGTYIAMARGQVDVEGGLVRVLAPRDGRIDEVKVEDGAAVRQGDVLATLDLRQARIGVASAEAALTQAQAEVAVRKARLPQAQTQARRVGEAADAGAATGQSADESVSALAVLKAEIGAAEAAVKVAQAHVEEARAELDARTLKAPVAGRVVRRSVHVGDIVGAQTPTELFQILPDRPRIVRAELNETYVDQVKPGMAAEVVRDSDQGKVYPAKVLRIGEVFGPSRLTDDPVERAGAHDVECVLELENGEGFRIGQRVLVRFRR